MSTLKPTKLSKHDEYVEKLMARVSDRYDHMVRNVPLYSKRKRNKRRLVGEIDLMGVRKGRLDIFEVKCSYRITKARYQLQKIKKLLEGEERVRSLYFFCGLSGKIVEM